MKGNWYYFDKGLPIGPITQEELGHLVKKEKIRPDDLVYPEKGAQWEPAKNFDELSVFFQESELAAKPNETLWIVLSKTIGKASEVQFRQKGPYNQNRVLDLIQSGEVGYHDYVWAQGMETWAKIVNQAEFNEAMEKVQREGARPDELKPEPDVFSDDFRQIKRVNLKDIQSKNFQTSPPVPGQQADAPEIEKIQVHKKPSLPKESPPNEATGPELTGTGLDASSDWLNNANMELPKQSSSEVFEEKTQITSQSSFTEKENEDEVENIKSSVDQNVESKGAPKKPFNEEATLVANNSLLDSLGNESNDFDAEKTQVAISRPLQSEANKSTETSKALSAKKVKVKEKEGVKKTPSKQVKIKSEATAGYSQYAIGVVALSAMVFVVWAGYDFYLKKTQSQVVDPIEVPTNQPRKSEPKLRAAPPKKTEAPSVIKSVVNVKPTEVSARVRKMSSDKTEVLITSNTNMMLGYSFTIKSNLIENSSYRPVYRLMNQRFNPKESNSIVFSTPDLPQGTYEVELEFGDLKRLFKVTLGDKDKQFFKLQSEQRKKLSVPRQQEKKYLFLSFRKLTKLSLLLKDSVKSGGRVFKKNKSKINKQLVQSRRREPSLYKPRQTQRLFYGPLWQQYGEIYAEVTEIVKKMNESEPKSVDIEASARIYFKAQKLFQKSAEL